jgi:alkyl hydroperoxide reductase subunit AhpC
VIVPQVGAPAPDVDLRDQHGAPVRLLSDFWPHGAVARAYGVLDPERGCPLRGTFVIDPEGLVHWCEVVSDGRDVWQWWPVLDELMAA